jgi:hypothetical protein
MEPGFTPVSIPAQSLTHVTPSQTNLAALLTSLPEDFDVKHEDVDATQARLPAAKSNTQQQPTNEQRILSLLRHSLLPFSDRLDPFAALPVALDRFQEHLVTFYLLHYPKVTYGLSPLLSPHPVATNFSIALTTPACFHVALARSALYRLSLSKYAGDAEKKSLELAMMRHKGEAIKQVRLLNSRPASAARKDDLIASMISLGTLDRRTGDASTSGMHYKAVRRMLKASGGPLAVQSLLLSRVMVFFECIYGTSPESYIWDHPEDLKGLTFQFNNWLTETYESWVHISKHHDILGPEWTGKGRQRFYLKAGTPLHTILTRSPIPPNTNTTNADDTQPTSLQRLELMTQLTCLLTLTKLYLDHLATQRYAKLTLAIIDLERSIANLCPRIPIDTKSKDGGGSYSDSDSDHSRPPPSGAVSKAGGQPPCYGSNTSRTRSHRHPETTKEDSHGTPSDASTPSTPFPQFTYLTSQTNASNIMWTLHITDPSREHTRRIWATASYAWVAKHLSFNVQEGLKGWLVRFLCGESVFADGEVEKECTSTGKVGCSVRDEVGIQEQGIDGGATTESRGGKRGGEEVVEAKIEAKMTDRPDLPKLTQKTETTTEKRRFREKPFTLDAWAFSYAS